MFLPRNETSRRRLLAAIIALVAILTGLLAWASAARSMDETRHMLRDRTETSAYLLNRDDVAGLTGTPADETNPSYVRLKRMLGDIKQFNSDARVFYLAQLRGNDVHFLVDSEAPDSDYYSPPGEFYPDTTPLFRSVFTQNAAAVEGPLNDEFGSWVSGLAPVHDASGKVIAVLGIDIAASSYYQRAVFAAGVPVLAGAILILMIIVYERIRQRDQRLLRLRSELVSIASHELRSPLSGIRWASENLLGQLKAGPKKAMAQDIYVAAKNLQSSIDSILRLSHLNSGKPNALTLTTVDIAEMLRSIVETQRLSAEQKGVHVLLDTSLPHTLMVRCDADQMGRSLSNLAANAIKYTRPHTKVEISYDRNRKFHIFSISDHGIGIPAEEQDRVFQGFYRASNAKASGIEGTGIGLYLTKNVVEKHGGTITMQSQEDKGTTFVVSLPRKV